MLLVTYEIEQPLMAPFAHILDDADIYVIIFSCYTYELLVQSFDNLSEHRLVDFIQSV